MNNQMIEKVARALFERAETASATELGSIRYAASPKAWEGFARAALSAYNPDERLREAAKVIAIIKQAVAEYEGGSVPKGTVGIWLFLDQWKTLLSALSPLPQGDDT